MLSAAALRRRLLERQALTTTAAASLAGDDVVDNPSKDASGVEPGSKAPVNAPKREEAPGTFERMLLEGAQAPAADDDAYVARTLLFPMMLVILHVNSLEVRRPLSRSMNPPGAKSSSFHPSSRPRATFTRTLMGLPS